MQRAIRRLVTQLARTVFVAWWFATSLVWLLAAVPFTRTEVLQAEHVPGLQAFISRGFLLAILAWLCWLLTIADDLKEQRTNAARAAGILLGGALVESLLLRFPGPAAAPAWAAIVAALIALAAPIFAAVHDWRAVSPRLYWYDVGAGEDRRLFVACAALAPLLAFVSLAVALGVGGLVGPGNLAVELSASLLLHLGLAVCVFAALTVVRGIGALGGFSRTEFLLTLLLIAVLAGWAAAAIILPAVAFRGAMAIIYAAAFGTAAAATLAGIALRTRVKIGGLVESGIELALTPLTWQPTASPRLRRLAPLVVPTFALAAAAVWGRIDWDGTLRGLSAVALVLLAFAQLYRAIDVPAGGRDRRWLEAAAALAVAFILLGLMDRAPSAFMVTSRRGGPIAPVDASAQIIQDVRRSAPGAMDPAFYAFLQQSSNIPDNAHIAPPKLSLVDRLEPARGSRPNIFLFVVDSLRPDYLSPYNPKVTSTPNVDEWSRDAIVFKNAFTRYAATGLGERAIWAGGLTIHKQKVAPFGSMNTLQRLISTDGYETFVGLDATLKSILEPGFTHEPLEPGVAGRDFDLCRALDELQVKLDARGADSRPVFAYSQSRSIHAPTVARQGTTTDAAIRKLDGCFGLFIAYLKATARYDDSIVILTADHGGSPGDDGRAGHAYTVSPEVLRVPLIVHVPARDRRLAALPDRIAFTTDITPTLYYLLGHRPVVPQPQMGRPLLTESPGEQDAYRRDRWLVASSYGPVYGVLDADGRSLTVADAINYSDYAYALSPGHDRPRTATPEDVTRAHVLIHDEVALVNSRFGFTPRAR